MFSLSSSSSKPFSERQRRRGLRSESRRFGGRDGGFWGLSALASICLRATSGEMILIAADLTGVEVIVLETAWVLGSWMNEFRVPGGELTMPEIDRLRVKLDIVDTTPIFHLR